MGEIKSILSVAVHSTIASDALMRVIRERQRQINQLGYTSANDDQFGVAGELADSAACFALSSTRTFGTDTPAYWPWMSTWHPSDTPIRDLEKAGALILAEIERLLREKEKEAHRAN